MIVGAGPSGLAAAYEISKCGGRAIILERLEQWAGWPGLLAARTALGMGQFDPWRVNIDAEYHEGGAARRGDTLVQPRPLVGSTAATASNSR